MPYISQAQRGFMHAKHPKIAAKWDKKYGGGGRHLPQHVKESALDSALADVLDGDIDCRAADIELYAKKYKIDLKTLIQAVDAAVERGDAPQYYKYADWSFNESWETNDDKQPIRSGLDKMPGLTNDGPLDAGEWQQAFIDTKDRYPKLDPHGYSFYVNRRRRYDELGGRMPTDEEIKPMKRFKDLKEVLDGPGEPETLSPRAPKEVDFAAMHLKVTTNPEPQSNSIHSSSATIQAATLTPGQEGETERIMQGTSVLPDQSGFHGQQTPPRQGDKRAGENTIISGPSGFGGLPRPVQEDMDTWNLSNRVIGQVMDIASGHRADSVSFPNGKILSIQTSHAIALLKLYNGIDPDMQVRMAAELDKGPSAFLKVLDMAWTLT